jgi:conjugative relaxase-like TrwC/TraI family protein
MLSFCNVSAAQAEHYYQKDDYYTRDEAPQSPSYWTGKGATTLGLEGAVDQEAFTDLLHGLAPDGTFLLGRWVDPEKHRAATDYTFSAPKSVSIAALVQEDDRVLDAHTAAVETALSVLEKRYAQTRISTEQGRQRITTGNLIAAVFPHNTSRELEPQLHSHCVVINATQLPDGQWRSFSNEEVVQNQKLLGQIYQNELAHGLKQLGYSIELKAHGQFEVAGYSPELLKAFSTRRHQIEELIKTWESESTTILDRNGNPIESKSARYEAATLRSRKAKPPAVDRDKLQRGWSAFLQLKEIELPAVPEYGLDHQSEQLVTAEMVIESGVEHCSERESVFRQTKLERFVFENHLGEQPFNELEAAIAQSSDLIQIDKLRYTTQSALQLELNTIRLMQQGQGKLEAIAPADQIQSYLENKNLTEGQREAINLAIATSDQCIAIQGVAGAGKSYALDSVRAIAQAQGYEVKGYAPSAEAASVLGEAIGIQTETISRLLIPQPPNDVEQSPPQLWIVDEAGLLSMRQAHDLLQKAQRENARVILVGDRRQLSAVEAGNPFKSLQAGGIATARLDESLRQKTQDLRIAVKAIAQGNISAGVQLLIIETNLDNQSNRLTQLVRDYTNLSPEERKKTLLLAGTNRERQELTQQIRTALQAKDSLGQNYLEITGLRTKDMTTAQAQYVHSYEIGDVVVPHQDYKKQHLEKNQQYRVVDKDRASNRLTLASADGNEFAIDPAHCLKKSVYQPQAMTVAVGDRLRWSKNDTTAGIRNGQTFTVQGFENNQTQIEYADGKTDLVNLNGTRYVDYAWVSTTYSAQGKTAERVLATTDRTLNQESFYVICSRAKYQLTLYTDDKAELLRLAQISRAKENVSDYLPILTGGSFVQSPDIRTDTASTPATASQTEQFSSEAIHYEQQSPSTPSLRERIAERLRAANRAALPTETTDREPTTADRTIQPDPYGLTAAIDRLDFSPPAITPALDDNRDESGWDIEPDPQQSSSRANDPQSNRLAPAPRPGREPSLADEPERTIQPAPTEPEPEPRESILERLTQFAEQLQRETEANRDRARQAERSNRRSNRQYGYSIGAYQPSEQKPIQPGTRTESTAAEVAAPDRLPDETPGERGEPDLPRVISSVDDDHDLRDHHHLDSERNLSRTADEDESTGEYDGAEIAADGETVEPEPIDYGFLWQQYYQQLPLMRSEFDKDGAIARQVLQDLGVEAAYQVIAQSPHVGSEEGYAASVVAFARQIRLPHEQQERGELGLRVMNKLLSFEQTQTYNGSHYLVKHDESSDRLTVEAQDGRGEILRCEGPYVVSAAITEEDAQVFEQVDRQIDLEVQRRRQQQQQQQQQRQQQSKKQSRGFEMD